MLYEDRLYGFAVAAMAVVDWEPHDARRAARAMEIAVAMEVEFTARLKARRDAVEQAAKKAREDAARAESEPEAPAEPAVCDWTTLGTPCGKPAAAMRVQRGLMRERPFCAAHEKTGETLGYWMPKAAP